jgi:hypothetical protein
MGSVHTIGAGNEAVMLQTARAKGGLQLKADVAARGISAYEPESEAGDSVMSADEQLELYIDAAWRFARVVGFEKWKLDDQGIMNCLADLSIFFRNAKHIDAALLTFCDRVIWGSICAGAMQSGYRALWDSVLHPKGIYSNPAFDIKPQKINGLKARNPFYTAGLPIMLRAYLAYLQQPSYKIILDLNEQMHEMEFGAYMRLFYALINAPVEG